MTILQAPLANIASTSTMQLLQDENGTLYAGLLAFGWNLVDAGGARLQSQQNGSYDGDAPIADGALNANATAVATNESGPPPVDPNQSAIPSGPSAPTASGDSESIWTFHNDRNYNVGIMGFNYGDIGQAAVPPGEIWTLTLQSYIAEELAGWQPIAEQIFDNSYDTTNPHSFSHGPLVVPFGRILTPGATLELHLQFFLGRTGSGSGTLNGVVTTSAQFITWPAL